MRALLPIIGVGLLLTTLFGMAVVVWLPATWRRLMVPALPVVGAMALAVGLHATGLIIGVRLGLPVLVGLAIAALGVASFRRRWWQDLISWPWLLLGLAVGAVSVWVALSPARPYGATVVEPGGSQDAFGYITNSTWLIGHPLIQHPDSDSVPAWYYTRNVLDLGLRQGEEVDQAAIAVASGHDPVQTWYAVSSGWLLLLPGALIASASLLRLPPTIGVIAAPIAGGSSLLVSQVVYSNSAALLGLAMAPLALALTARYLDDAVPGNDGQRLPGWFAAGALTALAATYTEYLPLVAPGLVAYALVAPRLRTRRSIALLRLLGLAALIGPLGWFRAVKSLALTTGSAGPRDDMGPFFNVPFHEAASHYAGTLALLNTGGDRFSYVFIGVLGAGIIAALALSPSRRFFAAALGSVALGVVLLSTVHPFAYGQARALEVTAPVVIFAGVAGYAALARWLRSQRNGQVFAWPMVATAVAIAALMLVVNYNTNMPYLQPLPQSFAAQFVAARQWLTAVAGPHGGNSMVLATQTAEQVWLQYELRDLPDVQFPFIQPFYSDGGPPLRYFDGRPRRYAVVETNMVTHVDPSTVVGRAGTLSFLDLSRGPGLVALGATGFDPLVVDAGVPEQWMSSDGEVILIHDTTIRTVVLRLHTVPGLAPISIDLTAPGVARQTVAIGARPTDVRLTLPSDHPVAVHLHCPGATAAVKADPRLRPIALLSFLSSA